MTDNSSSQRLMCRGVRGATQAAENTREEILRVTGELLTEMVEENGIKVDDIASIMFSVTTDLNAVHPPLAARELLGWHDLALFNSQELEVPGSLPRVIRVLIHWNTTLGMKDIKHVYINGAESLRPDRARDNNDHRFSS